MKRIIVLLVFMAAANTFAQVSVVANKSVSEGSITISKVASIYSLEQTKWADGSKIVVLDNSGDSKTKFYPGIGKDPLAIKKEWMKKQLTGEAKAPETLGSDSDIISKVGSTPGAVGYVKSSSVTGSVKVLAEIK